MSDNSITFIAEDIDRFNTFNDPTSSGIGVFANGDVFFFELGDDGLPAVNMINSSIVLDPLLLSQIESRFRVFNPSVQIPMYQIDHGFTQGDVLVLDPTLQAFRNATSSDIFRAGTVTAIGPGPNYFYLDPLTKIISNLEPGLPGPVGGVVWLDPSTGNMSTTEGSSESAIYIKMTDAQPSFTVSTLANPTAYNGWQFMLNEVLLTVSGSNPDPQPTSYIIDLINSQTSEHSVTASMGSQPTIVQGTVGFPSTAANPSIVFSINSVQITVETPSLMINQFSGLAVGWWDFVRPINELTQEHGVYATVDPNNGWIILTNASGGPINIVDITPSTSDVPDGFLTFTDACGFQTSNPSGPADYLYLERTDGGPIIITDYNVQSGQSTQLGSFVTDSVIPSVANGQLPLALVVDQSMYANANYVVPSIAAMDALTNMRVGDQVFVQAANNGQWATYVYTASGWILTGTQASAETVAGDFEITVNTTTEATTSMGVVAAGARILNVTIQVTAPFTSDTTLTIGNATNLTAIMDTTGVDLTTVGAYSISSSFVYTNFLTDFNVYVYFYVGSATSGSATIQVSYI